MATAEHACRTHGHETRRTRRWCGVLPLIATLVGLAPLAAIAAPITLQKPANGATVTVFTGTAVDERTANRIRLAGGNRLQVARQSLLAFTWSAEVGSNHVIYGCLQRTATFHDDRYGCNLGVASWVGNSTMRAQSVSRNDLRNQVGNTLYWSVRNCWPHRGGRVVIGGQRYACAGWPAPRSLRVVQAPAVGTGPGEPAAPASAATWETLRPAFGSPSCTNCHAIGTTTGSFSNQLQQVQQVVPAHPTSASVSSCIACHSNSVVRQGLPGDVLNIAWHTAPSGSDFRGRSSATLCQMAKQVPPSAPSALDHLRRDPLILWAVSGGRYPSIGLGPNRQPNAPAAFPGGINAWRNALTAWVDAGMPCP